MSYSVWSSFIRIILSFHGYDAVLGFFNNRADEPQYVRSYHCMRRIISVTVTICTHVSTGEYAAAGSRQLLSSQATVSWRSQRDLWLKAVDSKADLPQVDMICLARTLNKARLASTPSSPRGILLRFPSKQVKTSKTQPRNGRRRLWPVYIAPNNPLVRDYIS